MVIDPQNPPEIERGDIILAGVRFPRHIGRRRCLVTKARRHEIDGKTHLTIHGRYWTNQETWSTQERVLMAPWEKTNGLMTGGCIMRRYIMSRTDHGWPGGEGRAIAKVIEESGHRRRLPHLVHHSPDGFEWGYAGSGPADLARSIVGDLLGIERPHPSLYGPVKRALIEALPPEGGVVTEAQVRELLPTFVLLSRLRGEGEPDLGVLAPRPMERAAVRVFFDEDARRVAPDHGADVFEWAPYVSEVEDSGGHVELVADVYRVGQAASLFVAVVPIGGGWDEGYYLVNNVPSEVDEVLQRIQDRTGALQSRLGPQVGPS